MGPCPRTFTVMSYSILFTQSWSHRVPERPTETTTTSVAQKQYSTRMVHHPLGYSLGTKSEISTWHCISDRNDVSILEPRYESKNVLIYNNSQ